MTAAGNIQINRQTVNFQQFAEALTIPGFNQRFHLDIEGGVIALSKKVTGFCASIGAKLMGSNLGPTNGQRESAMRALPVVLQKIEPALLQGAKQGRINLEVVDTNLREVQMENIGALNGQITPQKMVTLTKAQAKTQSTIDRCKGKYQAHVEQERMKAKKAKEAYEASLRYIKVPPTLKQKSGYGVLGALLASLSVAHANGNLVTIASHAQQALSQASEHLSEASDMQKLSVGALLATGAIALGLLVKNCQSSKKKEASSQVALVQPQPSPLSNNSQDSSPIDDLPSAQLVSSGDEADSENSTSASGRRSEILRRISRRKQQESEPIILGDPGPIISEID